MSIRRFWALLALLAGLRLGVMALTPVFDPSEARYATMAANMARTGDFVVPHFTYDGVYQTFDGKPPLVFQAGGLFCRVFGVNEFAVRLFPFLCAILLGALLYGTVRRFAGGERARLAALVYGSSAAFYATAGFAMTDVPLATCVAGALLLYRLFLEDGSLAQAAGVSVLLGCGMLVKGPVSLVLFGLPVLADAIVNRRWKGIFNVKWLAVAPLYLLVAVPWFVLVERQNPGSVYYFFVNENFKRFLVHDYGDRYGAGRETFRGMAIVWTFLATLPWALLPLWQAIRAKTRKLPDLRNFALLAVVTVTLFWCLTSRTLISYLLPVTPMFAAWLAEKGDAKALTRLSTPFCALIAVGLAVGLAVGSFTSEKMRGRAAPELYGFYNCYSHEFYHGTTPVCTDSQANGERLFEQAIRNKREDEGK